MTAGTTDGNSVTLHFLEPMPERDDVLVIDEDIVLDSATAQALGIARAAVNAGYDLRGPADLQLFFYLPFGHSEDLVDQERSVELAGRLGEPSLSHAKGHRDIIHRFGRFPHRNGILARTMKEEEQRFLDEGGFAG